MALPPVLPGALQLTVALRLPAVPTTTVGWPGVVAGVTGDDGVDAAPVPPTFVALTLKVYGVPFASPVTTAHVGDGTGHALVVAVE